MNLGAGLEALEAWHNSLAKYFRSHHPTVSEFVLNMQKEEVLGLLCIVANYNNNNSPAFGLRAKGVYV